MSHPGGPPRPDGMTVLPRLSCTGLALTGAVVGGWALLAPASFWSDFPGAGRGWVAAAGPYDEHLVRDVGALYLALAVVALAGLRDGWTARVAGAAWLVFSVPHLGFHAVEVSSGPVPDAGWQLASLASAVVLAVLALLPAPAPAPAQAHVPAGAR